MVREYTEKFYVPAIALSETMMAGNLSGAQKLASWKESVDLAWPNVAVQEVAVRSSEQLHVGERMLVEAIVQLGSLVPDDVVVELYHGPTNGGHELGHGTVVRMDLVEKTGQGSFRYTGEIPTNDSGAHAFAARIRPLELGSQPPLRDLARPLGVEKLRPQLTGAALVRRFAGAA